MSNIHQGQISEYMERFINMFQLYDSGLNGHRSEPISVLRKEGFEQLTKEDFPTRRDEDWKYTSVTPIVNQKFVEAPMVELRDNPTTSFETYPIQFSNGYLISQLPQVEGVEILTLADALKTEAYKHWIEGQLGKLGGTLKNTFLPLNQAFGSNGLFIKVKKNVTLSTPLHIQYNSNVLSGDQSFFTSPQMFIWMEGGSNAQIIEEFTTNNPENAVYFTNVANRIELGKNSKLVHLKLQNESYTAQAINNTLVSQMRDSNYSHYTFDLGGGIVRNNLSISLLDSNTESHLYGAFIGFKDQHIDNQTFIDHAMPHCQSNEMYKGILLDKARGVFNGKVLVRQDAQKTNAFQQSSSLVLSPTAVMDTKPQLEIFADDVKCSHGATIGHLDESSVFYLNSRGLSKNQAKSLLKRAFISEVVDHIENEDFKDLAYERIEAKLNLMNI
jgi:Fe-S cluster assembly protein SufD